MTENKIIEMLEVEKAYMDSHGGRSQSEALTYAIEAVKEIQQYRAIGTIEEFKVLKEKNEPKKVENIHAAQNGEDIECYGEDTLFGYCPKCGNFQCTLWNEISCGDCGQALDWQ